MTLDPYTVQTPALQLDTPLPSYQVLENTPLIYIIAKPIPVNQNTRTNVAYKHTRRSYLDHSDKLVDTSVYHTCDLLLKQSK